MPRILQVVLPSYNEEVALSRLFPQFEQLGQLLKEELRLLVVDDGSRDNTSVVARKWQGKVPVSLIQFPQNRGYGAALEAGVCASAESLGAGDLIATMDADDTHPPSYLESMVKAFDSRNLDVVIASRYAPGAKEEGVSWDRRLLSRGASFVYRWAFHLPEVRDYSCGYRLFRAGLIQRALEQRGSLGLGSGFYATGELLLRLREQTKTFGEVPFELHYERKPTASKMPKAATILGTLRFLWRVRKSL
jgi:dolichol-phosphate mannosyltransferase